MGNVVRAEFGRPVVAQEAKGERVSAEVEDGYTRTANELQKAKCRLRMAGREHCVLEAVIYATYGWNKKRDRVTNTYLADLCDMDPSDINKALQALAKRNIIHLQKSGHMKLVGVNKVVSEWVYERTAGEGAKKNTGNFTRNPGNSTQKSGCFHPSNRAETPNTQDSLTQDNPTQDSKRSSSRPADAEPEPAQDKTIPECAAIHARSGKTLLWGTADDLQCAQWFCATRAKAFTQRGLAEPKAPALARWANDVRLMREHDGRGHREICELFAFVCRAGRELEFCQSPDKLRSQWDALQLKRANAEQGVTSRGKPMSNIAAAQQRAQALKSAGVVSYGDDTPL